MNDRNVSEAFVAGPSPTVSHAIETRRSVRGYLSDPVPESIVREILATASRAASGGNLQPWKVSVLAGEARDAFVNTVAERMKETPFGEGPEYEIYPPTCRSPIAPDGARSPRTCTPWWESNGMTMRLVRGRWG